MTPDEAFAAARAWLRDARRVVALTGAGISTESGIPDFRGPQGVWTKNPEAEKMATLSHYVADRFGLNPSAHKVGKPTGRRLVHCRSRQVPRPLGDALLGKRAALVANSWASTEKLSMRSSAEHPTQMSHSRTWFRC